MSKAVNKLVFLFFLYAFSLKTDAQISFGGFDTVICAQPISINYTYSNYTSGGGGPGTYIGVKVFRDGILVLDISGNYGYGKTGLDLLFINDSTGFLIYSTYGMTRVLKTADYGTSWVDIGGCSGGYFGFYPMNVNYTCLVTLNQQSSIQTNVTKCSDMFTGFPYLISDDSINADIYITDTISGNTLCNRDSLKIYINNDTNVVTYHINFVVLPLGVEEEIFDKENEIKIYPNPAREYFHLSGLTSGSFLSITDIYGRFVKEFNVNSDSSHVYYIDELAPGLYIINVLSVSDNKALKLIKNP